MAVPAGAPGQPPAAAAAAGGGANPTAQLASLANQAEVSLVKLASGLAQAGADPQAVTTVHHLADITRQIGLALTHGTQGAPEAAGGPAQPGMAPGAPGPAGAPMGAPPGPETMDTATQHLHHAMQQSAIARQGGRP